MLAGVLAAPHVRRLSERVLAGPSLAAQATRAAVFAVTTAVVLVYLRPIDQFIYFQF